MKDLSVSRLPNLFLSLDKKLVRVTVVRGANSKRCTEISSTLTHDYNSVTDRFFIAYFQQTSK